MVPSFNFLDHVTWPNGLLGYVNGKMENLSKSLESYLDKIDLTIHDPKLTLLIEICQTCTIAQQFSSAKNTKFR